ncbi:spore coat protein CotS [Salipaludibacillus neizhouensis]|uniref:Spore coat protein CotS n=1 Tax=Salipaludibacillus neizhouensis TaxID=885475 RepID=A0A3A9K5W1_9BACI|nr:CotS family spore coat protein [Salipaludibacillus neizhouensis]RKL65691.1 spore coat protein CotS [Salipaludibacillus neizhouensis]
MSEEQLIIPWEIDSTLGKLYVPPYIEEMALEVLQHYNFKVNQMEVMATKEEKGGLIWKIETDQGPKSLKILHRRPIRSLFSIGAQEYLRKIKKARVPSIVKTNTGENTVEMGGKIWFVAEWIESLYEVKKDLEGTKILSNAIGEFHHLSKGYVTPIGAEHASRLYRWPKAYKRTIKKMKWFKDVANTHNDMPASRLILSTIDTFQEQARRALTMLENSPYSQLTARGNKEWGLAHQDYGWGNGKMGTGGMWIIDLDGVAYDIPIRDLRKLIEESLENLGKWDVSWILEILEAYHEANPIEDAVFEILLIDMALPNLFYKNMKEMLYEPRLFLDEKLKSDVERIIELDHTKWPVIEQLRKEWKGGKNK